MSGVRWPWQRRRLPEPPDIPVHLEESERAVAEALRGLAETRRRGLSVRRTASTLRQIRQENDFARTIRDALKP